VDSYNDFFAGSATIAGALVGLLFVALSVQPERNRDRHSVEHRAVAGTAFTALIDALFTSLIGLQPGGGLQYGAVIFGAIGLISSINLARRLRAARREVQLSRRWSTFMGFIIVVYAAQLIVGLWPMSAANEASYTAAFIYAMFSLGIARSWELLGMQSTSLVDTIRGTLPHAHPHTPPNPSNPSTPPNPGDPPAS
jgi:multisubunit Na+/H+ antiporter MnhB subunit